LLAAGCSSTATRSVALPWIDSFLELADGDCVNIDGKCLRRAASKSGKIPCIVSAYSSNERIVIGQVKTVRASP